MTRVKRMNMLEEKLESVRRSIQILQANEAMLEELIRQERGEPSVKMRAPRSNVKQAVIDLLTTVGATGLNASQAVALAAKEGVALDRGSVSSLLSRMKNEGIVGYDGSVYKLIVSPERAATIHPIRTSGVSM